MKVDFFNDYVPFPGYNINCVGKGDVERLASFHFIYFRTVGELWFTFPCFNKLIKERRQSFPQL